jgi:hypothetical protein
MFPLKRGLIGTAMIALFAGTAGAAQQFNITNDTFLDSGSPGSPSPTDASMPNVPGSIVNGQDIYSYGGEGKIKAVASNYSSSYPFISYTHTLITLPQSFWNAIGTNQVISATVNYFPFNDSLSTSDAHTNLELHPLTQAFTTGNGLQNGSGVPPVASTTGGATWMTTDGSESDKWTTPGGDYDPTDVLTTNTSLPISKSTVPFTWDITSLLNNATTKAELQNFGALIKVNNESTFPSTIPTPPGVNDFVSFYSSEYMTAPSTMTTDATHLPFVTLVVMPEPVSAVGAIAMLAGLAARRR